METIIVVDDNRADLRLAVEILAGSGYHVRPMLDGPSAVEGARAACPDLFLLDVTMPGTDGYTVCRQLKADARTSDVPVIFISASNELIDKVQGFDAGGVDYVAKPFQPAELLARVHVHLTMRQMRQRLAAQNALLQDEIAERQRAEQDLQEYRQHLEEMVAARTAELQTANARLRQEIAERAQAGQDLRASEARYRSLVETMNEGLILTDASGRMTFVNPRFCAMVQMEAAALIGHPLDILLDEANRALLRQQVDQRHQGRATTCELELIRRDGQRVVCVVSGRPVYDQLGGYAGAIGVLMDITERQRAEQVLAETYAQIDHLNHQLHRSNRLLRVLFDNLRDGLGLIDRDGKLLAINEPLAGLYNSSPQQLVQRPWGGICPRSSALVEQTFRDGQVHHAREHYQPASGQGLMLDLWTLPVMSRQETVEQVIVHVVDITEQLQIEAQIIAHERFAANGWLAAAVAHEVNSPLQAVECLLHLAGEDNGTRQTEYLQLARDEIRRAGHIVRQLLDLYRPEASSDGAVDINALIERELLLLGSVLAKQGITVERDLAPDLPPLWGRADDLTQVLLNLLMNASQAMPEGGRLAVRTRIADVAGADRSAAPRLVVVIADSGVGVTPEVQARMFEPFFTTKAGGSGLGLTISAKIVAAHGGSISCQSSPGAGCTFTLTFPIDAAEG